MTGTTNLEASHTHSGSVTINPVGSHTHTGTINQENSHTHTGSVTIPGSGDHNHTGTTFDVDNNTHSHVINTPFTGSLDGGIDCDFDTHKHEFTIPKHEVNLCIDSTHDLQIAARFVPSPCIIRVAVVNKNFWEYYWYALCICTRAIWHEAEFGPATCEINETPTCEATCEDIDCSAPDYVCPSTARNEYEFADGEDVSWFGLATDTTLINTQTTCTDYSAPCVANVHSCANISLPSVEECLGGCANVDIADESNKDANEWDDGTDGLDNYCPDSVPANFSETAFMRDFEAGVFNYISDGHAEHIPEGNPPF
jgi:hypothetical protein